MWWQASCVAAGLVAGKVLVVDDDPTLFNALRVALATHDIVVDSAVDADSAASMLSANQYCGLVLDLVLAHGSGFDVLRHIATSRLELPTVVVTSKLPSYVREMLNAEHVKLVFPKPVEPRLLAAIVLGMCGIAA